MKWHLFFPILLFSLTSCQEREMEKQQRVALVHKGEKNFSGITRAAGRVNLSFRVDGPLIERRVSIGDKVKVGDLLARIDPREFEIEIKHCKGELEKAEAELRFAKAEYQRSLTIQQHDPGAISQAILDRKKEDVLYLEGEIKSLLAQLESAENLLSYTSLISPYEGTIVGVYVEKHEFVNAREPIIRILNNQQMEMVIEIPESLICHVPRVSSVYVTFDVFGDRPFKAKVKEIGEEADDDEYHTYPVTLLVEQEKDVTILAGMVGHAHIEIADPAEISQRQEDE